MNAFALILLQKRVADAVGAGMGTYTHRANSFHVYERDYGLFDGYVRRLRSGAEVTYRYVGEWDELMEDARPAIEEMVRQLKEKA
jgi:thymidylate synthase